MKNRLWLVYAALGLVSVIYGATFVAAKEVMPKFIMPDGFIFIRIIIAFFLLTLFQMIFIRERIKSRKDYLLLATSGLFGVAGNMLLFYQGLAITSPINASLIMTTTPVVVLILAAWFLKERITLIRGGGILLGAIGAILLIWKVSGTGKIEASPLGDLLVFMNAVSYAIYLVLVRPLMKKYHPLTVIRWTFTFAVIYVIPFGWKEASIVNWQTMPEEIWGYVAFIVIGTTFIAYLLNAWSLRYVRSSVVGSFIYLQPLCATLIAVLSGKYILTPEHVIFGLMIFIGVYLVNK